MDRGSGRDRDSQLQKRADGEESRRDVGDVQAMHDKA